MCTEVDGAQLIESIKKKPVYNKKHKHYKCNDLKKNCWIKVSVEVDIPVEDCKRLWRNLTGTFNKERRLQLVGSTAKSDWKYYDQMSFFSEYSPLRKTVKDRTKANRNKHRDAFSHSGKIDDLDEEEFFNYIFRSIASC
ncbi:hypothetical protein NQ315_010526 [Exocentrus adspersus]|uniref:MADF domain-containing protein n=1 Tax=Exocentrus adspersus TaxID=1586481 RepID=A0AAV8W4T8_9CUCU|nr:hypothetical protein NQ315_010526 [Exocentrus adspersus]